MPLPLEFLVNIHQEWPLSGNPAITEDIQPSVARTTTESMINSGPQATADINRLNDRAESHRRKHAALRPHVPLSWKFHPAPAAVRALTGSGRKMNLSAVFGCCLVPLFATRSLAVEFTRRVHCPERTASPLPSGFGAGPASRSRTGQDGLDHCCHVDHCYIFRREKLEKLALLFFCEPLP